MIAGVVPAIRIARIPAKLRPVAAAARAAE
jgi:hypothetical protein